MATQEQIRRIFQKMRESHSKEFFHHMDETQAGIGAELRLLYIEKKPVTAGKISDTLGISTARAAVATLSDLLSVAQPGSPKKGIEIEMFQRPAIFFFDE